MCHKFILIVQQLKHIINVSVRIVINAAANVRRAVIN